ncbi:4-hydroxy-tetrahydrodipicolinate reductase [Blastopirellula sp. J2-11]|uniref:4-hydroxy-tetrahydrodipicolinate reductase n=1 Tax=Blastopirellula sp. J2-11 TaxID=2943192 RepID=UPI0021CA52AA|nr:4-hydroxy-tetrahydrodipicolinate reductase [Blastopirellula sp. J2-11]UUO08480.1 4-hydroxy-tetrahydrodipicolinate reductase [Blastopirellula sp. J2-11]
MSAPRVVISGAAGRMGQRLIALGHQNPEIQLVAALEHDGHPKLGEDAGAMAGAGSIDLPLSSKLEVEADALIDFSIPAGAERAINLCVDHKIALVMATTGLTDDHKAMLQAASQKIPVVWAPSMSLAVNLTMKLTEIAAAALKDYPAGADVEIVERHHRFKEDSPSGTALKFGEIVAAQMGQTKETHGREGRPGERPHDEIGYHAIRVGDNPGEHTIIFGLMGETIELTVRASNRDCYANGALKAAQFAAGKPVGLYTMSDVLGL